MKGKRIFKGSMLLLVFLCFLALVSQAGAISSTLYAIDWNVMGGGGGPISGTAYQVNGTAGQAVIGPVSGSAYQAELGYWVSAAEGGGVYLPIILRNYP
jgi:hypothetical protein